MAEQQPVLDVNKPTNSLVNFTQAVYGLQVLGMFTVVGFIIAIIINYVKLPDARGTWLETHFRWQIRTFWFGLLWVVLGTLLKLVLIGFLIFMVNYIWVAYRIIKGWIYLNDKREMQIDI